jgi:hypothetical protein
MHPQFFEHVAHDRQRQLRAQADAHRLARDAPPRPPLAARAADARRDVGFRLVAAGLRLALGRRDRGLTVSRLRR